MTRTIAILVLVLITSGCAMTPDAVQYAKESSWKPTVQAAPLKNELKNMPKLDGPVMTIAVYSFLDKTGQRKPASNIANLSSAVSQGSEVWVIKALQEAGEGTWFQVVERVGLDNLVKERQLIRSTREQYERTKDKGVTPLKPMVFAGLILEGGIVGYDSNVAAGGVGARYLGVGLQTEYRIDTVTVVMRIVSVSTGKVLLSVATEKVIASSRSGADVFKFLDMGTKAVEAETGYSVNEPVNYAVRAAIEAGIIEIINQGERDKIWSFKVRGEENIIKEVIIKPKQDTSKTSSEVNFCNSEKDCIEVPPALDNIAPEVVK
ncbi:MAG: CsgG/HfaB family protein [Methylophagaceae bacterium]